MERLQLNLKQWNKFQTKYFLKASDNPFLIGLYKYQRIDQGVKNKSGFVLTNLIDMRFEIHSLSLD